VSRRPDIEVWRLDRHDRFGRSVVLTREANDDFTLRIEPSSQRDEGETMRHLNRAILLELADIVKDER
jgi:hypothetical protein